MSLLAPARRGSAVVASVATAVLITLGGTGSVHASGARDSDHDGMPDRWEVAHHLDPHRANAHGDPDHDGLTNLAEYRHGTRPHNADTDGDGDRDGSEVHDGCASTDPTNPDTDGDGVPDGQEDADGDGVDNAQDSQDDTCSGDDGGQGAGRTVYG